MKIVDAIQADVEALKVMAADAMIGSFKAMEEGQSAKRSPVATIIVCNQ